MFTPTDYKDFLATLDIVIKIIAGGGGLYLFFIGLKRYLKDQTWRRNEFVAKEMKDFTSDPLAINAMYILDWGSRYIELFPTKSNYDDRFAKVDRKILKSALQFHGFRTTDPTKDRYTRVEVAIRDSFDRFFSYFERFQHFVETGLITEEELRPYLQYWINTISVYIEDDVKNLIFHFVNQYNYTGTQKLFEKFGADIMPKTNIETTKDV